MNIALIFAGGTGTRMNIKTKPKQFLEVDNKPILIHTIEKFQKNNNIDAIVVVCLEKWIHKVKEFTKEYSLDKIIGVIPGGKTAQESQYKGLKYIKEKIDQEEHNKMIVLIHDGVRPLINDELINENITTVQNKGNSITVTSAIETIVRADNDEINEILDRDACMLAKAPQSFIFDDIYSVHLQSIKDKKQFIDSASMFYFYGKKLFFTKGNTENIKITTAVDYYLFNAILEAQKINDIFG